MLFIIINFKAIVNSSFDNYKLIELIILGYKELKNEQLFYQDGFIYASERLNENLIILQLIHMQFMHLIIALISFSFGHLNSFLGEVILN